jgi:GntR family transcriptional regulator, colanic acid and biofilm gene transcriptional regulator
MFALLMASESAHALRQGASSGRMSTQSETLAERTYARLRHGLIVGQIAPGECITVGALARQLGTSVTPVRNALSQLAAADALRQGRQSGLVAPILSGSELDELLQLRLAIEGFAFANAAPHYRASDRSAFKLLHADLGRVAELDGSTRFATAVWPLRRAILGVARSSVLTMLVERLWCRLGPTFTYMLAAVEQRRRISCLLGTIITAIGRHDLEQARKALVDEIVAGMAPSCGADQPSEPRFFSSALTIHHNAPSHFESGADHE